MKCYIYFRIVFLYKKHIFYFINDVYIYYIIIIITNILFIFLFIYKFYIYIKKK